MADRLDISQRKKDHLALCAGPNVGFRNKTTLLECVDLVHDALPAFRSRLPDRVAIWAGGRNPLLARRAPAGVLVLDDLGGLSQAVQAWHLLQGHHQACPP